MYISLILIVFFICGMLVFLEDYAHRWNTLLYISMTCILIALAAFRPLDMDNDSMTYYRYFMSYDDPKLTVSVEWSYLFISAVIYNLGGDITVLFLVYATLGVTLKMIAMRRLSPMFFAPVCVYIGNIFLLQEFTQIRAGVATAFFMLAIKPICEGQRLKGLLLIAFGAIFHYSCTVLLLAPLFSNNRITYWNKWKWAMLVPVSYVIYFMHIGITSLPIPYIEDKLTLYDALKDVGFIDTVNVFNALVLVKAAMFLYLIYFHDTIVEKVKYLPFLIKMLGISLACFVTLADLPVLSFRMSDLAGVVETIAYSCIIYSVKPGWVGKVGVFIVGLVYVLIHCFSDQTLKLM